MGDCALFNMFLKTETVKEPKNELIYDFYQFLLIFQVFIRLVLCSVLGSANWTISFGLVFKILLICYLYANPYMQMLIG